MVLGKLPVPGRPTIWITVGQGPTALAVGAGGGCLDIFTLIYPFSPMSPSLWERVRYRLKYCLKGPLNPKQPTNQSQPWPNSMRMKEPGLSSHESDLFVRTSADEKVGLSTDDREFMQLVDKEFRRDSSGNWVAPLPFRCSRQKLPNNGEQALHRARILYNS